MPVSRKRIVIFLMVCLVPMLACSGLTPVVAHPVNSPTSAVATVSSAVRAPTQAWPQADGTALGSTKAQVIVQEFGDFQCPICAEYFHSVEPLLIKNYVATGKIRYEYHNYIVIDSNVGGTESRHAAEASLCANDQERFWDFHSVLFNNQQSEGSGAFSDPRLKAFAVALGLDGARFNACFDAHKYGSVVDADQALGDKNGVQGTPTVFVNGVMANNALDYASLKQQIDQQLSQK